MGRQLARLAAALLLVAVPGCSVQCNADPPVTWLEPDLTEQRAAIEASERFLAQVDMGAVDETWEDVAVAAKTRISQGLWSLSIRGLRKAAGEPSARELIEVRYTENLPNAPEGRYFVVECSTEFARFDALERVVALHEAGEWRVAGYEMHSQ